jgi:hypothetical protein
MQAQHCFGETVIASPKTPDTAAIYLTQSASRIDCIVVLTLARIDN